MKKRFFQIQYNVDPRYVVVDGINWMTISFEGQQLYASYSGEIVSCSNGIHVIQIGIIYPADDVTIGPHSEC